MEKEKYNTCEKCGKQTTPRARFCNDCRTQIFREIGRSRPPRNEPTHCWKCGDPLKAKERVCTPCKTKKKKAYNSNFKYRDSKAFHDGTKHYDKKSLIYQWLKYD